MGILRVCARIMSFLVAGWISLLISLALRQWDLPNETKLPTQTITLERVNQSLSFLFLINPNFLFKNQTCNLTHNWQSGQFTRKPVYMEKGVHNIPKKKMFSPKILGHDFLTWQLNITFLLRDPVHVSFKSSDHGTEIICRGAKNIPDWNILRKSSKSTFWIIQDLYWFVFKLYIWPCHSQKTTHQSGDHSLEDKLPSIKTYLNVNKKGSL